MHDGNFEKGENTRYDAQVARTAERKHARYADIDRKVALEKQMLEQKDIIARQQEYVQEQQQKLKHMKDELKEMEKLHKSGSRVASVQAQEAARAAGEKTYMTGLPCKNGHYARRYTSSGACTECDRIGWKDGKLKETSYT